MNRSYRLELQKHLSKNELTAEYLFGAVERYNGKIAKLARLNGRYAAKGNQNKSKQREYKEELDNMIAHRRPLLIALMDMGYSMAEVKKLCAEFDKNKLPTYEVADKIIDVVNSGDYGILAE